MGNESSVPSDGSGGVPPGSNGAPVDELEEQAKAPPSVSSQQQVATPSTPQHQPISNNERRSSERRPAARMIGAVFGKGSRSNINQQTPPPPQLSAPESSTNNSYNNSTNGSESHTGSTNIRMDSSGSVSSSASGYYDASMVASPTPGNAGETVVASHDYFAQAQQQNLQAEQQQQLTPPLLVQANPPQSTSQLDHQASMPMDVDQKDHPAVGVMFEKTTPTPPAKKSIFPGRATARGAALISSMRNLTLGGAFGSGNKQKKEVNDWEKQWDADEDDDSDEDDEDDESDATEQEGGDAAKRTGESDAPPMLSMPQHQQPDIGHSELPLPHGSNSAMSVTSIANGATMLSRFDDATGPSQQPPPQQQQQQQQVLAPSSKVPPPTATNDVGQHDLATEWDMAGIQPPTAVEPDSDGAVPITTMQQQQQAAALAKPNVQMFLPMLRVLGKGSFGKVVLVQKRTGKERGGLFAMKILRKTHLVKRRQIERTRTERKVLSVVNHPFIMKLHYAFQTPDKLYLVLDYCPGGELFFHLSRFRRFPERVARFYAAELLLAIGHLHKRGIIYRDLKPENVLLDSEGHVKLGDFGLAKAGIKHPCEGASSMCGTPEYMAPEVLAQAGHGFCVDYWGLGMLLYEMMTGLPPWYTTDRAKLFRRLKSAPLDVPSYFSGQAANCVSALLERNPRRRLGVTGIRTSMEHEFFRNISWKSLYARRVEAPIRPCEGWRQPTKDGSQPQDDRIMAPNGTASGTLSSGPMSLTDIEAIHPHDLDDATKNFDNTFTRMPVESEEMGDSGEALEDLEVAEQLNEETFLGFSFDSKDRDVTLGVSSATASPVRPRSSQVSGASSTNLYPAQQQQQQQQGLQPNNPQYQRALD